MGLMRWLNRNRLAAMEDDEPAEEEAATTAAAPPETLYRLLSRLDTTYVDDGDEPVRFERHEVRGLRFPDGQVVVCDPLASRGGPDPVAQVDPEQDHVVEVIAARRGDADDTRNAFALLRLRESEPVSWSIEFDFRVDTATACFASRQALDALEDAEPLVDALDARLQVLHEGVAAFATGYGDGWYGCWLGADAEGQAVVILTPFDIVSASVAPAP
ncbi:MAG TPA: DUF4241 domain-containing protein [Solirubrobacteraceae bacterium]|jgi:hypothetical protein